LQSRTSRLRWTTPASPVCRTRRRWSGTPIAHAAEAARAQLMGTVTTSWQRMRRGPRQASSNRASSACVCVCVCVCVCARARLKHSGSFPSCLFPSLSTFPLLKRRSHSQQHLWFTEFIPSSPSPPDSPFFAADTLKFVSQSVHEHPRMSVGKLPETIHTPHG